MSLPKPRQKPLLFAVIGPTNSNEITTYISNGLTKFSSQLLADTGQPVDFHFFDGGYLTPKGGVDYEANNLYKLITPDHYDGALSFGGVLGTLCDGEYLSNFYHSIPVPMVEVSIALPGISTVVIDNASGIHAVTRHLIDTHQYREIGFLSGPANHPEALARFQGFQTAMAESNLAINTNWLWQGDFTPATGIECALRVVEELRALRPIPRALVCANDEMARGFMETFQAEGFQIPHDIAIVGFDNREFCALVKPRITSVDQPVDKMVSEAALQLVRIINGQAVDEGKTFHIASDLVIRDSCGCKSDGCQSESDLSIQTNIDFAKAYFHLRDARYAADTLHLSLQSCADNEGMSRVLNGAMQQFGIERWSLFLIDPSNPSQSISFAASKTGPTWSNIWLRGSAHASGIETEGLRIIRSLLWDGRFQGAIVIDCIPDMLLAARDLSMVINTYLHNREAQRTLSMQNDQLAMNLALLQATQQSLVEARKIASLGHLLAGFSHEINTPLGVAITVNSFLESLLADLFDNNPESTAQVPQIKTIRESNILIGTSLNRIRDLIRQLQMLAQRDDEDVPMDFDLAECLDFALLVKKNQLLSKGITASIQVDNPIKINTLRNRLLTVINQLLENAMVHAWPSGQGGTIVFTLVPEADSVRIHYRDDGIGLAPAIQSRVFEPFVTTARIDRHMGLGLHLIFLIITHMLGGHISIDGAATQGLSIIITLPRAFTGMNLLA